MARRSLGGAPRARFEQSARGRNGWPSLLRGTRAGEPPTWGTARRPRVDAGRRRDGAVDAPAGRRAASRPDDARRGGHRSHRAEEHERVEREIFGLPASATDARIAGVRSGIADGTLRAYLVPVAGHRRGRRAPVAGRGGGRRVRCRRRARATRARASARWSRPSRPARAGEWPAPRLAIGRRHEPWSPRPLRGHRLPAGLQLVEVARRGGLGGTRRART